VHKFLLLASFIQNIDKTRFKPAKEEWGLSCFCDEDLMKGTDMRIGDGDGDFIAFTDDGYVN
jgi:hypothetical protein